MIAICNVSRKLLQLFSAHKGERIQASLIEKIEKIQGEKAGLERFSEDVSSCFLEVGNSMRAQAMHGLSLMQTGNRVLELSRVLDDFEHPVPVSVSLIREAYKLVEETGEEIAGIVELLEKSQGQLNKLKVEVEELVTTLEPLKSIQTLFRIEAANLPENLQSVFHSVITEIARLNHDADNYLRKQGEMVSESQAGVSNAATALSNANEKQKEQIISKKQQVEQLLSEMKEVVDAKRRQDEHMVQGIGEIERISSGAIVNLQYEDITKQRIDHVRKSFDELDVEWTSLGNAVLVGRLAKAGLICRLESQQLSSIEVDIVEASDKVNACLKSIKESIQEMNITNRGDHAGKLDSTTEELIGFLKSSLDEVGGFVDATTARVEESIKSLEVFEGLSLNITRQMEELAMDIQLIGLNSKVQAVHAGSPGLEVLSGATHEIARETSRVTASVNRRLEIVVKEINFLVEEARRKGEHMREFAEGFVRRRDDSKYGLDNYASELLSCLASIENEVVEMGDQVINCHGCSQLQDLDFKRLGRLRLYLDELGNECEAYCADIELPKGVEEEMDVIKSRYTMDSERMVFDQLAVGSEAVVYDSSGDGPELWDDFEAEEIGLCEDEEENVEKVDLVSLRGDEAMGENVELF